MTAQLDELIEQQINLGHKDPHKFYDLLVRQLGDDLVEIAKPYLADFIAEMARHRIGARRRAAITNATLANAEIKLQSLWVPGDGGITYKRIGGLASIG